MENYSRGHECSKNCKVSKVTNSIIYLSTSTFTTTKLHLHFHFFYKLIGDDKNGPFGNGGVGAWRGGFLRETQRSLNLGNTGHDITRRMLLFTQEVQDLLQIESALVRRRTALDKGKIWLPLRARQTSQRQPSHAKKWNRQS